ncbi:MAG: Co2+/Mg2+ efflux protein ApaG [Planctomycetes bacterium]|nr:Co2+/Mg2+ efflux protein ApaG [Planctomycetota bacterium]
MRSKPGSSAVTEGIRIEADAQFLPERSEPRQGLFLYAYRIRMANEGTQRARLRTRYWKILDAHNELREVRGPGVVGRYPDLAPGERFEYFSSCPLATRWGTMEGAFQFEREDGTPFEARVERFFLVPNAPPVLKPAMREA